MKNNRLISVEGLSPLFLLLLCAGAALADGGIACIGFDPPPALQQAASELGLTVTGNGSTSSKASILLADRGWGVNEPAGPLANALKQGRTVVIGLSGTKLIHPDLADMIPVNTDIAKQKDTLRDDALVIPFGSMPAFGEVRLAHRFDLFLPIAPIEQCFQRSDWILSGKGLLNTDWKILATNRLDTGLPLLISGRAGPGRVLVFAGSLADPLLVSSSGAEAFYRELLKACVPVPPAPEIQAPDDVSIVCAPWQPGAPVLVLENKGNAARHVLLSYKLSNFKRELLHSTTVEVDVPAQGRTEVPLQEGGPENGDPAVRPQGSETLPWRRVCAGFLAPDRSSVISQGDFVYSNESAVAVDIAEDSTSYGDMADWPQGEIQPDGRYTGRYVYRTGVAPAVRVVVRNGLMNVAPLAQPKDLVWPDNPTAQGVNDLAYGFGGFRDAVPVYSIWSGKSDTHQAIQLTWPAPVTVAGQTLVGCAPYRNHEKANPPNYRVQGDGQVVVAQDNAAVFAPLADDRMAICHKDWKPVQTQSLTLSVDGLDPKLDVEPHTVQPSNLSLVEWEVYGWPAEQMPPKISADLFVHCEDLTTGKTTDLPPQKVELDPLQSVELPVQLPSRATFGPVRYSFQIKEGDTVLASRGWDALFVPATGPKLLSREKMADMHIGLLCSPGFVAIDDLGTGMAALTGGWGASDDKTWAYTHGMMEIGTRNFDQPNRMLTSEMRMCHYTSPWHDFPNGQYAWDWASDRWLDRMINGDWKGKGDRLYVGGSDRWNGIGVGSTWSWSDFVAFDTYLRSSQGKGLEGKSRHQIIDEITEKYGDVWQHWQMNRYADRLLAAQTKFTKAGKTIFFETHGSFPMAGGELGEKLAKTDLGVGTDLFWELRREDLWWSLGSRFAVVAANPDLDSGAYGQWGWITGRLNNFWFANNSPIEPSRRQWYSTYFTGRVDSQGQYFPYHMMGFSFQGGYSPKFYNDDRSLYLRTLDFMTQVRPEAATGYGMVVSWAQQERRMGPKLQHQGFGLFPAEGAPSLENECGDTYGKLLHAGMPIDFVTSTSALSKWSGTQPLVVVDGYDLAPDEVANLQRLNSSGAPIVSIGVMGDVDCPQSDAFYGVQKDGAGWKPLQGTRTLTLDGGTQAFVRAGAGGAPVVWVPVSPTDMSNAASAELVRQVDGLLGGVFQTSPYIAPQTFVAQGSLFVVLADESATNRMVDLAIRPGFFKAGLDSKRVHVIDLDHGAVIPTTLDPSTGLLKCRVSLPASDGRALELTEDGS